MPDNRLIEKIQKMLALANNESASEGERDNALRMAWALIRKHNLDIEMVESHSNEEERIREYTIIYGRPWAKNVCVAMAKLFFCEAFFEKNPSHRKDEITYNFIGKESNAITAKLMSQFLVASIRKEAGRQMRDKGQGATYRRSFATGAANSLWNRVKELQAQPNDSQEGSGTSLTVIDVAKSESEANQAFMNSNFKFKLKTAVSRAKEDTHWDAYVEGIGYGKKLPLNTQVGGDNHKGIVDNSLQNS